MSTPAQEEDAPVAEKETKKKKKGPKPKLPLPKVEESQIIEEEEQSAAEETNQVFENPIQKPFSDKEFSKAMSKIKDRVNGT
jgi:hypothetical protein